MRVVYSLPDAQLGDPKGRSRDSVVTIGAFDGIHRGHRVVIDSVRQAALDQGRASVVVTFFPHPSVVLGYAEPFYLTSTEEKIILLDAIGIDLLVVMPFTIEISHTRAADYVSMLVEHLRMREVHVGYDFAFGYKREGNVDFLKRIGPERGFNVREVEALSNGGESISSTGIRQALRQGDVEPAARWLGRPFRLSGTVVKREEPDRSTGLPAACLDVWQDHAIPADGAYAGWAWVGNLKFKAMVSVGSKPRDIGKPLRTVEARLLDFDRDIHGMNVALDFVARLRGEQPSPDAIAAQLEVGD